jgi:peptide/nickel transport system substrate-binding protein
MYQKISKSGTVIAVSIMLALAGCSKSSDGASSGGTDSAATVGGTLKVLANGDVDHLDPQLIGYVPSNGVSRAVSRSLLSYVASDDAAIRGAVTGDLAAEVPTPSADGLTYEIKLRDGITWDAPDGARPIVAKDVARGIERICTPYQGAALGSYFIILIQGMDKYCKDFAGVAPTVEAMKAYIEGNDISGIETPDDTTVIFHLVEPSADFTSMLSLTVADPAPVEVLDYLPDSPEYRANFIASGPYKVGSYIPDSEWKFVRNPSWNADSDPLRKAYVDEIVMTMGLEGDAAMQQLEAGSADMLFDIQPSAANIARLTAANDAKFSTMENGGIEDFMWFNTKTTNNNSALQKLEVRQAIQYAIDKSAVQQILGGESMATVVSGIFGPGINGYKPGSLYGDGSGKADPAKAKELLAAAGVTNLTLKLPYINNDANPDIAQTIQVSLEAVGIKVELSPVPPTDYYSNFMTNPDNATSGVWDIAIVGWNPDWPGDSARSVYQPQFTFNGTPQTYNYVDFNSDKANALASKARAAATPAEAGLLWQEVDKAVMEESPIVSIVSKKTANYHSERIQNYLIYAMSQNGDWTNVWLKQ